MSVFSLPSLPDPLQRSELHVAEMGHNSGSTRYPAAWIAAMVRAAPADGVDAGCGVSSGMWWMNRPAT